MIICAPLRLPPCSTKWVRLAKSLSQETAPEDFPFTPCTTADFGLKVEPFVPTPPPRLMISMTSSRCFAKPERES